LNLDAPPSIWGIHSDSDARSFWIKLYILKTKDLWNNTQATGLLQSVAKALERVDTAALPTDDAPVDQGCARLAYLEGETSLLAVAPRTLLDSQPNYEFDPLPPAEEDNIFTTESSRLPWMQQNPQREANGQAQAMLHQLQHMLGRRQVRLGGAAGGADDDDDDDQPTAAQIADDEELMRDLEEHAARANEPGLLGMLMGLLGVGGGSRAADRADGEGAEHGHEMYADDTDDEVPGAWPEDEHDDGGRR
jgi:hypothetical protein